MCVCRAFWFLSTAQQATDWQLPIQWTDSAVLLGTKLLLLVITTKFAFHDTGLEQDLAVRWCTAV